MSASVEMSCAHCPETHVSTNVWADPWPRQHVAEKHPELLDPALWPPA